MIETTKLSPMVDQFHELTEEALVSMAKQMVGKPMTNASGKSIGVILDAYYDKDGDVCITFTVGV